MFFLPPVEPNFGGGCAELRLRSAPEGVERSVVPSGGAVALAAATGAGEPPLGVTSDCISEFVDRCCDGEAFDGIDSEFVVPSAQVLDEGVPSHDDPGGVVAFESAHRT